MVLAGLAVTSSVVATVSITMNTLDLVGSAVTLIVVGGATAVTVNALDLVGSAITLTVIGGATSVTVNTLVLVGSVLIITPQVEDVKVVQLLYGLRKVLAPRSRL